MAQPLGTATGTVKPVMGTAGAVASKPAPAKDLDRVRRNIEKLIGAGAPKEHIDTYLSGEGYTADTFRAAIVEKPKNEKGFGDTISDLYTGVRDSLTQGMTLGFSDEVGAAGAATGDVLRDILPLPGTAQGEGKSWSEYYDRALTEDRAKQADFSQRHPILSTGAMVAGGLGIPINIGGAGSALGTIGKMTGMGAGLGATAGFGAAEGGLENRLSGAGIGAGLGAGIGAVVPSLAAVGSRAAQLGKNMMGVQDPAKKAADLALKAMSRDNLSVSDVAKNFATTKPVMLADQGRNLQRLGRTVETVPGAGSERATAALRSRQLGQGERVVQDVRGKIANVDYLGTKEALQEARKVGALPLYQEAFALGPVTSPRIEKFIADPILQQGIKNGLKIQRLEALADDVPFNPSDYAVMGFNAAGDPILAAVPNMRLLDAAKRGLDDILEGYRDTTTGKLVLDQTGRAIDRVRAAFVKELDRVTTDPGTGRSIYSEARKAWSGPSQSLDAMAMGRAFARGDSEVVARTYQGLSPTDREFFKMGVVRQIEDTIMKSRDGWDTVSKIFGSKDQRARLASLFDSPNEFMLFEKAMKQEARMFETQKLVTGGSPTGRIAAEQADAGGLEQMMFDLATTGPRGAAMGAIGRGWNRAKGINEGTADELSKLLFEADPMGRIRALQALLDRSKKTAATSARIANTAGRALGTTANVGSQSLAPAR